jgi:transposase-like protein
MMFPLVEAKQGSGMSAKEFCAAHEVPEHVFYYWQRRYREHLETDGGFVRVELNSVRSSSMRLNLGGGRSLDLAGEVSPQWLGALIRELD